MENLLPFEKINREVLVKKEIHTNSNYGCNPEKRPAKSLIEYGIININKPSGPTSHQITDYVKKILDIPKAGHSGTLDPAVTGCLPTALDKATKVIEVLLSSGKEYVGIIHIHKKVEEKALNEAIEKFRGVITQLPPLRSAIKRQLREREVYYLEVLEVKNQDVLFRVGCQAGFYVRKLAHDLGKELGTGAHLSQLIRTKVGYFKDTNWHSLHDLKDAYESYKKGNEANLRKVILPFEYAVYHLPKIWILDTAVDPICHGSKLAAPGISKLNSGIKKGDRVAIMSLKDELIAIGNAEMSSEQIMSQQKNVSALIDKTFMTPGTYPIYKKGN